MSFKEDLKKEIIAVLRRNLEFTFTREIDIRLSIKRNNASINNCVKEYIEEFGEDKNQEIDIEWIEDFITEYFQ